RVSVSVPVAGYSAVRSRIERPGDVGDIEQNPADLLTIADYSLLTAIRAPRPTLLIYNAEDDCCFRGPLVKPYIFGEILPFFRALNVEDRLGWHLNTDPSNHNYQVDNRQQAYRFFARHFGLTAPDKEIPVEGQIKSPDELKVGLPENNLTVLGLARKLADRIHRTAVPPEKERAKLRTTVRYQEVKVERAWALANTYSKELESRSYRLLFSNGLSASATWLRALTSPEGPPATIVVNDKGKKAASNEVAERLNRADQVLAIDPLFIGDSIPTDPGPSGYAQMLSTIGDRALGFEAAQLIAGARWLRQTFGAPSVRIEASGIRAQVISRVAAALEPELFSEVVIHDGMPSLQYLLDKPVEFREAPDLFCFGLYKEFDLDRLA
ncbi:MAG: hypothetical protein GY953_58055, partial [bacterium]|nr:hypothetical protein [bacterium]